VNTPTPDDPFESSDPDFDPWADDPDAPQEPGMDGTDDFYPLQPDEYATNGPRALLEDAVSGEIGHEIAYQQTMTAMKTPPQDLTPPKRSGMIFLASMALFILSFASQGVRWIGVALVVMLVHELGHFFAMRAYGYRNVKLFFLPFFGAAVSGTNETAPAWKQAVMILLGPLPGLLIGFLMIAIGQPAKESFLFELGLFFVVVNAFNLIPILPLDGGRLFEVLFLARRPWLGTIFRLFAIAAIVAAAIFADDWALGIVMGILALILLGTTRISHKITRSRAVLSAAFPHISDDWAKVADADRRQLFDVALQIGPDEPEIEQLAGIVRQLHGQAATRPAGVKISALLLFAYFLGWALTFGTVGALVYQQIRQGQAAQVLVDDLNASVMPFEESVAKWKAADPDVRAKAIAELQILVDDDMLRNTPQGATASKMLEALK